MPLDVNYHHHHHHQVQRHPLDAHSLRPHEDLPYLVSVHVNWLRLLPMVLLEPQSLGVVYSRNCF
jgi:hypothetical protein